MVTGAEVVVAVLEAVEEEVDDGRWSCERLGKWWREDEEERDEAGGLEDPRFGEGDLGEAGSVACRFCRGLSGNCMRALWETACWVDRMPWWDDPGLRIPARDDDLGETRS